MKKKIGFFGGCFNPPSNIHINLAKKVLEENKLDQIVFVPVGNFYEKAGLVDAKHRYNMLELLVENEERLFVDDIELNINKRLYAVDIFKLIEEKYNNDDIYYIMGSDNFEKMPKWKEYDNIIEKYNYIIMERENTDISSTNIRNMMKNRDSKVKAIIDAKVYNYIEMHKLYQE